MQILTFKTFSEVKWMNRFWICAFAFTLCCEKERTKDPYQSGAQCQWLSAGLKVGWTLWLLCFVEVFFFFALTSYLIVCGKVQKNYTTNTFSTRLPDKRSGPQEETALNKVKRWRWTTFKSVFKEAGIQSNLSVVFRICSSHLLSATDWGSTRTTLLRDCIQPTVVWISPKSRLKSTSTPHHQNIWCGSTLYEHSCVFLLANRHTYLLFLSICGTNEGWADRYCSIDTAIPTSTHLVMTP